MHVRRCLLLALVALFPAMAPVAGAQDATVGGCAVAPRSLDEVLALALAPDGSPAADPDSTLRIAQVGDLPPGDPVDAATVAAIDALAWSYAACLDAGDPLRLVALFTPAMIVSFLAETPSREAAAELLSAPRASATRFVAFGPARDARRLADGRVGAVFVRTQPGNSGQNLFLVFAYREDRWLLDEIHPFDIAPAWGYRVVAAYPHDRGAFTQGLVVSDGVLYEGTGLEGYSTLRRVDLETGAVLRSRVLAGDLFGEGVAVVGDRVYQLTWREETCFVYDRETFALLETFAYEGEGWGLTTDGERLIMSDGTDRLVFRDPATFAVLGEVRVRDGDAPVVDLNELEYIDGQVWANVWQTDRIARVDPATGQVTGWLDLTELLAAADRPKQADAVLNGIAYDAEVGRVFVTGKHWPTLFEIELIPPA